MEMKAKFGSPIDSAAQREVMRRWAYNYCLECKLRRKDIVSVLGPCVEYMYIANDVDLETARIKSSWFKTWRNFQLRWHGGEAGLRA